MTMLILIYHQDSLHLRVYALNNTKGFQDTYSVLCLKYASKSAVFA